MNHLITAIVPAYNVAPWLPDCLDSILAQTYKNLEIIVIDDGSTDNTAKIIDEYSNKDNRIIAVHQQNMGLVKTRDTGIKLASGDFVTFVDGDDSIDSDMYKCLMTNAVKYNADISHCGMRFCFPDGQEEMHYGTGKVIIQDTKDGIKNLLEGEFIEPSLCNKLYRKELLNDSCLDPAILNNEDLLRNFTAFSRAKISVYEDICKYKYFQRENSMSKDKNNIIRTEKHISSARKLIVENSTPDIYPYAMRTWLSSFVNAINTLLYNDDPDIRQYCKECRDVLRKEKGHLHYLIKRQQYAAKMILLSLTFYKFVYRIYQRYANR